MAQATIPDEVIRFILLGIPSIPYLEAMLLLRRETEQPWDAKRVAQRLYLNEKAAQSLLAQLHSDDIVEYSDKQQQLYRYRPESSETARMIDLLAETYTTNLIGVTHLIHSKTGKKARQFADAFIWRKDS
jgi:Mn-dependent DtxR family transcriptional regulator